MAFNEVDLKRIEQAVGVFCSKRSPGHLQDKLRLTYAVKGHEVVIVERRPRWDNRVDRNARGQAEVHPIGKQMAAVLDAG